MPGTKHKQRTRKNAEIEPLRENLEGRVENLPFRPNNQILVPIFEAISNSINAIRDKGINDGQITIKINRDQPLQLFNEPGQKHLDPITEIVIEDNGIGFDESHFESFLLLDNISTKNFGTRGIGRLFWLKVFENVSIESIYHDNDSYWKRSFDFTIKGMRGGKPEKATEKDSRTVVRLINTQAIYKESLRYKVSTIAQEVVKHFLAMFILDKCPSITITDGKETESITKEILPSYELQKIDIKGNIFYISHVKTDFHEPPGHYINYCASARAVERFQVSSVVPAFPRKKIQVGDESVYYSGYITSKYLDSKLRSDRDGFLIDEKRSEKTSQLSLGDSVLYWNDIHQKIAEAIEAYLEEDLTELKKRKEDTVSQVLEEDFPELKYIKDTHKKDIEDIWLDASRDEIAHKISKIHMDNQISEKRAFKEIINRIETDKIESFEDFETKFEEDLKRLRELNVSSLASYIIYRRHILDIFGKLIGKLEEGEFEVEKAVHSIIFPRKYEGGTRKDYANHNLWIIDDRWALHEYIASDIPLKDHAVLVNESESKPDIVFYNLGFARDASESMHPSITIVELKRPGRKQYSEDPVDQACRYIDDIRSGKVRDINGHVIRVLENDVIFHVYVICDVESQAIKKAIKKYEFKPTFDGTGYRKPYYSSYNAIIEIIPFKKLLEDAQTRNKIFFRKLGINK